MEAIRNIFRICISVITFPIVALWGARRINRMYKKNIKEQDPNLYPYEDRWDYLRTKAKGMAKRAGIIVKVDGIENLPKGASWITPNHTSNLDAIIMVVGLGGKINMAPIGRDTFNQAKGIAGMFGKASFKYIRAVDGMFIDRSSPRKAVEVMNGAAQYAKTYSRGIVVFPEGTRSYTTDLLPFKNGSFKFAQKYFLPIVPITITGTLEGRKFFTLKRRIIKIIVHKPIKAIDHSKKPTEVLGRKISEIMQKDLDEYVSSLSKDELKYYNKLKEKAAEKMTKKEQRLNDELRKG